ncbi:hypothetical protein EJ04DRAFT_99341 [Polyplosphaeria fusca]|uniref:Azaphilone pigments biosynthesis cluster protein L N-terminal domain-containing protein n=1 Tax=Polyplosphaeria fusca TaxID=682080 RepID=A0A9P4QP06_9PLEO|nr:hypothetical protein EJ04DRAFT_99341 [Polyplosphaeria fusca]
MSGLEVVAGIAGVASVAIKISVTMNEFADELGSAGRDVRYISNEMACFSQVLRLVHSSLEDSAKVVGSSVVQAALTTLPQLIEQCGMVYDEANGLMVSLRPLGKEATSLPFMKRIRFIFQKSRIDVLRSLLDSSKSTLNLLLVTLNIEMAKQKSPSKEVMDQLQSERKAFIRVVASQSKALNEALKEVEKAKKEAAKLKSKADKEKEKHKLKETSAEKGNQDVASELDGENTLKPPPSPLGMLPSPSVAQLTYVPPQIDTAPQTAVMQLALSLEPARPDTSAGVPTPPPEFKPYWTGTQSRYGSPEPASVPQSFNSTKSHDAGTHADRPNSKRVFSDPGPTKPDPQTDQHLNPEGTSRERSRSPYGFSQVPKDGPPKVERKPVPRSSEAENGRNPFPFPPPPSENSDAPPAPKPAPYTHPPPRKPAVPPVPPPKHGTTYIALAPYMTHEIGHLNLVPFDTLVDLMSYTSEQDNLPYPTAFDERDAMARKQLWQASLHHRRGPRGLFPHDVVCEVDDEKVTDAIKKHWFAGMTGLVADGRGRVWVGPEWQFIEPVRRRSKWWAGEF